MTLLAKRAGEVKEVTRDSQFQVHHEVVPPGLLPRRDDMGWTKNSNLVAQRRSSLGEIQM